MSRKFINRRTFLKGAMGTLAGITYVASTRWGDTYAANMLPKLPSVPVSTVITIDSVPFLNKGTVTIPVIIAGLEDGLSGFDFILVSSKELSISNIVIPAYGIVTVDALDSTSTQIRVADLARLIEGTPDSPFELFTFDLTALDVGTHTVIISPIRLDDDSGFALIPLATFVDGIYEVTSPLTDYKFSNIVHLPNGDTQSLVRFSEGDITIEKEDLRDGFGLVDVERYRRTGLLREPTMTWTGRLSKDEIRTLVNVELAKDPTRIPIDEQKVGVIR